MKTIEHDALCEASARSRSNLTLWGAELKNGCGCAGREVAITHEHILNGEDIDCHTCHDTGYRGGFRCPDCTPGMP
jgi:hypothetical protein